MHLECLDPLQRERLSGRWEALLAVRVPLDLRASIPIQRGMKRGGGPCLRIQVFYKDDLELCLWNGKKTFRDEIECHGAVVEKNTTRECPRGELKCLYLPRNGFASSKGGACRRA